MSQFLVYHPDKSIGPSFKEAAAILSKIKDINILESEESKPGKIGWDQFVVEDSSESAIYEAKNKLYPGWYTVPN